MDISGYAGSILHVDLSSGKSQKETLDRDLVEKFLGGWGVTQKLAHDLIDPDVDPLSPGNMIIVGTGPFEGTIFPGSAELVVTTKFPLNGGFSTGCGGGHFGFMLKTAGYDYIVITGRAEKPVYLKIAESQVEVCDAGDLWGKDSYETVDALRLKYEPCSVIPIGPAGENLVKISVTHMDKGGTLGSGGLPAVMGSKNLKAMVVLQGSRPIRVADPDGLRKLVDEEIKRIMAYHRRPEMMEAGAMAMTREWLGMGRGASSEDAEAIYEFHKRSRRKISCPSCLMCDKDRIDMNEGRYAGRTFYDTAIMTIPFSEGTADAYGQAVEELDIMNRYGICRLCFGGMVGSMTSLYEQGIITTQDTDGLELKRDLQTVRKLIEMTAYREGFGDILAEGLVGAARKIGKGVEDHIVHLKGYSIIPVAEPRINGLGTMEFEQMVNPSRCVAAQGALGAPSYNRGWPVDRWRRQAERLGVSPEAMNRCFGPTSFNVGRLTRYAEDFVSVFNCLGLCHRLYISRFHHIDTIAQAYTAITGIEKTATKLLKDGERAWNLSKLLNVRAGFSRKDDEPPEAWFEPLKVRDTEFTLMDYYRTAVLSKEDVDQYLSDFYEERGWDKETSAPTPKKLRELGLENFSDDPI